MPRDRASGVTSVLLATDLSSGAVHAARRVPLLPLADGARVTVLCVTPRRVPRKHIEPERVKDAADAVAAEMERAARERGATVTVDVVLISGEPFIEIIRASRVREVDLVVLGRRSAAARWQIGSTAARVVRHGSRPVLVVDRQPAGPYCRAVVALDLSDVSPGIVELAKRVIAEGSRVRLVHAYHLPFEGFMATSMSRTDLAEFRQEERSSAMKELAAIVRRAAPRKHTWKAVVSPRDPRVAVTAEIASLRADLVVLGTHGRTGISRFLIGGVADFVLREAPCDVLIARPERFTYESP